MILSTFTIIDHKAMTCSSNIVNLVVPKISLGDDYLVYCTRKYNGAVEIGNEMIKTCKIIMKNFGVDAFGLFIIGLIHYWSTLFSRIIDKHAPICESRVSEEYLPWINKDLQGLLQIREKLKKQQLEVSPHSF